MWFEEALGQCCKEGAQVISMKIYLVTCAVAVHVYIMVDLGVWLSVYIY